MFQSVYNTQEPRTQKMHKGTTGVPNCRPQAAAFEGELFIKAGGIARQAAKVKVDEALMRLATAARSCEGTPEAVGIFGDATFKVV